MHEIITTIVNFASELGYTGIFLMMVLESSFIPFPSEVAMIPAGYLASIGKMDFTIALIVGTFGALVGSTINYFLGYFLGDKIIKKLVEKYGKIFFITEHNYHKSKKYFEHHGSITTFLGRFLPAIRQLISIPAGIFKMNYTKFFIYTGLGAGIWNLFLMTIGFLAGENKEFIDKYSYELLVGSILFVLLVGNIYYYFHKRKHGRD